MKRNTIVGATLASAFLALWITLGSCGSNSEADIAKTSSQPAAGTTGNAATPAAADRSPDAMPDFALIDLDGNTVKLSDYAGKAVLVNFWATWCPPCRAEIPDLVEVQKEYGGENFTIVGISMDQTGPASVKSFADKNGLNYPIVMGNLDVVADYGNFRGIPATFLLNTRHEKVKQYVGQVTKEQVVSDLKAIFDNKA